MKVWTVANQKGGVGKTTTTVSLAGLLAQRGVRTLVIDVDPHASLTSYLRYDPDALEHSSYDLFNAVANTKPLDPFPLLHETGIAKLTLLPASLSLAGLDRMSGLKQGLGLTLVRTMQKLQSRFEHVLIDCPPMLGVVLINALAACERLIIPVQTEFLALKGLERMLQTIKMINKSRGKALDYVIVPTLFDRRTRSSLDSLQVLKRRHAAHLWPGVIPIDSKLREASRAGLPPPQLDAKSRAVLAYDQLLDALLATEETKRQASDFAM